MFQRDRPRAFGDESFDAVIAFGPFYHLVAELKRVGRPPRFTVCSYRTARHRAHRVRANFAARATGILDHVARVLVDSKRWPS
jgi:hypothetical protein